MPCQFFSPKYSFIQSLTLSKNSFVFPCSVISLGHGMLTNKTSILSFLSRFGGKTLSTSFSLFSALSIASLKLSQPTWKFPDDSSGLMFLLLWERVSFSFTLSMWFVPIILPVLICSFFRFTLAII